MKVVLRDSRSSAAHKDPLQDEPVGAASSIKAANPDFERTI